MLPECGFFGFVQAFDLRFAFLRRAFGEAAVGEAHLLRFVHAGVAGAASVAVGGKACGGAVADAAVERAVAAEDEVDAPCGVGWGCVGHGRPSESWGWGAKAA